MAAVQTRTPAWLVTKLHVYFILSLQNIEKYQPGCSLACACEWKENIISPF